MAGSCIAAHPDGDPDDHAVTPTATR